MINNDFALIETITGYQNAAVITAAFRIGLFAALTDDPQTGTVLGARLEADPPNVEALLRALVPLGLVESSHAGYTAAPYTANRLGRVSEIGLVIEKEAVFAQAWLHLDDVVVSGRPAMESWRSRLESNPRQARSFLEALDVLARIGGPALDTLAELAPGQRVVDVGGGLGTYARLLDAAGSEVTLVDLVAVVDWAEEVLAGTGVACVAADVRRDPSCGVEAGSMDAALVSHMLHDLATDDATDLLLRVGAALKPGGHVVVNDFSGDSGPDAFGPRFDVMMRVETPGVAHSLRSLESIMHEAGFVDVRRADFNEPLTVLVGRKP